MGVGLVVSRAREEEGGEGGEGRRGAGAAAVLGDGGAAQEAAQPQHGLLHRLPAAQRPAQRQEEAQVFANLASQVTACLATFWDNTELSSYLSHWSEHWC
jgi:hypothetical protein